MTHEDQTANWKTGFIRIGWNVNKDGIVTGERSQFIEAVQLNYEKVLSSLTIDVPSQCDK